MNDTGSRIARAALALLLERGIRGLTGQATADRAGVSRMTVHRYFPSRHELVQGALTLLASVFDEARSAPSDAGFEAIMARLSKSMSRLPAGDLPTRLAEVREAYPAVYVEYLRARRTGLDAVIDRLFLEARAMGRLRSDLDPEIAAAFVRETTTTVLGSPDLLGRGVEPTDLFRTVKEILLYGLVQPTPRRASGMASHPTDDQ